MVFHQILHEELARRNFIDFAIYTSFFSSHTQLLFSTSTNSCPSLYIVVMKDTDLNCNILDHSPRTSFNIIRHHGRFVQYQPIILMNCSSFCNIEFR
ncbi:hypothetical protein AQUCO_03600124v1 [Aquilegia coerulea]|uniref:Uncharacterized protein n=1 Tax=Aquilegia coerulea TaxID=218851 RepID=A0A2G5CVD0_AQUCA|nr:hypothetical protein AQUCO_03600124v1 [Aquilegia coerulea]